MPLYSIWKKLVGADDSAAPAAAQPPPPEQQQQQPEQQPRPPPPPMAAGPATTHSTTSMASLRSQVESERQAASASSVYRDFAGTGHADAGHWNDPPTVVFKPHNKQPKAPKAAGQEPPSPSASPFMIVDRAVTPNGTAIAEVTAAGGPPGAAAASLVSLPDDPREQAEVLQRALRRAVASVDVDTASPMVARMVEDTRKRLQVLDERLPDLSPQLTAAVCAIALLVDQGLLAAATDAHRDLMQAGYDSELKWLVGIKRVIELRQKAT